MTEGLLKPVRRSVHWVPGGDGRRLETHTAFGSETSRKWVDCACIFTIFPFGNSAPVIRIGSPSFSRRVFIIQYGRCTTPSCAMNSSTPACVEAAGFAGLRNLNFHGDCRSNDVRCAKEEGGMITRGGRNE